MTAALAAELARCRAFLEPALARNGGTHVWADIVAGVEAGTLQLWPAPAGALVTEILRFPRKRICNVFLGGGKLAQLLAMVPAVEAWAGLQGCEGLTVQGRPGWARVLAPAGARPLYVALYKEITPCPAD